MFPRAQRITAPRPHYYTSANMTPRVMGTLPCALRKGDTITFVSPSGRLNDRFPARIKGAKAFLVRIGYNVKVIFKSSMPDTFRESVLQYCEEFHMAF